MSRGHEVERSDPASSLANCSSDRYVFPETNVSTWGRAAAIPAASGAYPGDAFSGFTQISR